MPILTETTSILEKKKKNDAHIVALHICVCRGSRVNRVKFNGVLPFTAIIIVYRGELTDGFIAAFTIKTCGKIVTITAVNGKLLLIDLVLLEILA